MQIVPKLTQQRLAQLPPGTPILIGRLLVTFNNCSIRPNYKGENETFIDYTDAEGRQLSYSEWTVLQSSTEFIDAVMCKYCGKFRQQADISKKLIFFWNRSETHEFCADTECARRYQQTIRLPSSKRAQLNKRQSA